MKEDPDQLWQRLVNEADRTDSPASSDTVSRIVAGLRWRPQPDAEPRWETWLWPLIAHYALPGAAALLIIAALLPPPKYATPPDSVDDLIAITLP
jgi:hypothetical protein